MIERDRMCDLTRFARCCFTVLCCLIVVVAYAIVVCQRVVRLGESVSACAFDIVPKLCGGVPPRPNRIVQYGVCIF